MNSIRRRVFYSFHFGNDAWRAAQVRNIGVVDGNEPVSHNAWEEVKRGGDAAIKRWIAEQLKGRTCTVVLVGAETATRPWVRHEIVESWNSDIAVFGVRIHKLLNSDGRPGLAGGNPFEHISLKSGGLLSTRVPLYDPVGADSRAVYATIKGNLSGWIEKAISSR